MLHRLASVGQAVAILISTVPAHHTTWEVLNLSHSPTLTCFRRFDPEPVELDTMIAKNEDLYEVVTPEQDVASTKARTAVHDTDKFWQNADRHLMYTGVPPSPVIIQRAKGTRLYDTNGKQILDFTSGQMSSLLGHSHPEIVEVVQHYVANLDHLISNMITQPVVDLAVRRAKFLPKPLEKSFFLNTGSETTEAAIKMAKCYTGKF
ncbi:hypothetical protein CBER1_10216 [Cercospora berteroae]|uniref:Ornithine aminotransferase n=1 Tax=Cercospora berteroae TaxID=357750 RepID=A0A2S6CER4_9PEZI|nr:hypothetical protein CBER1_10216 [Cercospora berteroae]